MSLIQLHLSKKEINTQSNCLSTTPLPNYNKITTHIVYKSPHNFGLCSLGEHTFWTLDMMMRRQPSSGIQPFYSPFWGLCILSMKQHQLFLSPDCHTFDLFLNLYKYSGFSFLRGQFITLYWLLPWKLKTQNHFLY